MKLFSTCEAQFLLYFLRSKNKFSASSCPLFVNISSVTQLSFGFENFKLPGKIFWHEISQQRKLCHRIRKRGACHFSECPIWIGVDLTLGKERVSRNFSGKMPLIEFRRNVWPRRRENLNKGFPRLLTFPCTLSHYSTFVRFGVNTTPGILQGVINFLLPIGTIGIFFKFKIYSYQMEFPGFLRNIREHKEGRAREVLIVCTGRLNCAWNHHIMMKSDDN